MAKYRPTPLCFIALCLTLFSMPNLISGMQVTNVEALEEDLYLERDAFSYREGVSKPRTLLNVLEWVPEVRAQDHPEERLADLSWKNLGLYNTRKWKMNR